MKWQRQWTVDNPQMPKFYCPNCGAEVSDDADFDEDRDHCSYCVAYLDDEWEDL